ncbi:hypothetical protein ACI6Q2_07860 [Chitinophagaceae bacterium LWZ2-11]
MTIQEATYILKNFSKLINDNDYQVLNDLHRYNTFLLSKKFIKEDEIEHLKIVVDYAEISYLENQNEDEIIIRIAKRMYAENEKDIFFVLCPVCGKLARTINARQCPNGHRW